MNTVLKMRNSSWILSILLLFSCSQEEPKKDLKIPAQHSFLVEVKGYLKDVSFPDSSILIWRTGSIEWSEQGSLLVVKPQEELKSSKIDVSYYEFYDGFEDNGLTYSKYDFSLNGNKNLYHILSEYIHSQKVQKDSENFDEGVCGNRFCLEMTGLNKYKNVSFSSDLAVVSCIKQLMRQISAKEYYQSLSLEKNCHELTKIKGKLFFGKFPDSGFQIPYSTIIPTLRGKPLEKVILPSGEVVYMKPKF